MEELKNNKEKKEIKNGIRLLKIFSAIIVIVVIVFASIYLLKIFSSLKTEEGIKVLQDKIQNLGVIGLVVLFLLQVSQLFLFFLPGEPIEILAGMCYGGFFGYIFITVSVFIITLAIFFLVKRFGKNLLLEFIPKEKIEKIENSKLFNNPKKIELIFLILYLIPGTPKDFLTYIGGLCPIKPIRFILIATLARFPSVISSTLAGASLLNGDIKQSLIIYGITFGIVFVIVGISLLFDKNKDTKKVLDEIK